MAIAITSAQATAEAAQLGEQHFEPGEHLDPIAGDDVRARLIAAALKLEGTAIMDLGRIARIRSRPASVALPAPQNFGTCIEHVMQITRSVPELAHFPGLTRFREIDPSARTALPTGAWHVCVPGSDRRPLPGDLFVLTFLEDVFHDESPARLRYGKGWFSHIGVFVSTAPRAGEISIAEGWEDWITSDGGGVLARSTERVFDPTGCVITGADGRPRMLSGWIDIVSYTAASDTASPSGRRRGWVSGRTFSQPLVVVTNQADRGSTVSRLNRNA